MHVMMEKVDGDNFSHNIRNQSHLMVLVGSRSEVDKRKNFFKLCIMSQHMHSEVCPIIMSLPDQYASDGSDHDDHWFYRYSQRAISHGK